jgi:hypothetical protein
MENYRIYCEENERAEVLTILRKYNDIVIDNIDPTSFGITIEREDPDTLYNAVLHEIDREVFVNRLQQDRIVTEDYDGRITDPTMGF